MGYTICIASLKGGVGKTTTSVNLSAALAMYGKKVLLIDSDPQGSTTTGIGIDKKKIFKTLYDALMGKAQITELISKSDIKYLQIVPARVELFRAELGLVSQREKGKILRKLLTKVKDQYDYIIIDTPPSLGLLSVNAINAADLALIPLQCEFLAYESLIQLLQFIRAIRNKMNMDLKVGILFTMYNPEEKTSLEIVKNAKKRLKDLLLTTVIPRSYQLRESTTSCKPLVISDIVSKGAKSYINLAKEIIQRKK